MITKTNKINNLLVPFGENTMKKTAIAIALALLSTGAAAETYFKFGVSQSTSTLSAESSRTFVSPETELSSSYDSSIFEKINEEKFKSQMITIGIGHDFNDYVSGEFRYSLGASNKNDSVNPDFSFNASMNAKKEPVAPVEPGEGASELELDAYELNLAIYNNHLAAYNEYSAKNDEEKFAFDMASYNRDASDFAQGQQFKTTMKIEENSRMEALFLIKTPSFGGLQPYVMAGYGLSKVTAGGLDLDVSGLTYGAGLEFDFDNNWSLSLEYQVLPKVDDSFYQEIEDTLASNENNTQDGEEQSNSNEAVGYLKQNIDFTHDSTRAMISLNYRF